MNLFEILNDESKLDEFMDNASEEEMQLVEGIIERLNEICE